METVKPSALLTLTRPRFWLYTAGPFLVGSIAGVDSPMALTRPLSMALFLYFLVPANLFLYGINDWFDADTDTHNAKKHTKEHLLQMQERRSLVLILAFTAGLGAVLSVFLVGPARWLMWVFLLLSATYSAPPLRWKARPFLDSLSNVLYAVPGFVGYALFTGQLPPLPLIIAAWAWTIGMHAYSAIPDITPDKEARIKTIAVTLGHTSTLRFVGFVWFLAAFFATWQLGLWVLPLWIYPVIPVLLLKKPAATVERWYWSFPLLTSLLGFCAFWAILWLRFGTVWPL